MRYAIPLLVCLTATAAADDLILLELSGGSTIAVRMANGEVTVLGVFQTVTVIEAEPVNPQPNPQEVTRVVYVWEKDLSPIPVGVSYALTKLNADPEFSAVCSEAEDDVVDGDGEIPDQYKVAIAEARKAGLPALVVERGEHVTVIKDPKTEADVMNAVKPQEKTDAD